MKKENKSQKLYKKLFLVLLLFYAIVFYACDSASPIDQKTQNTEDYNRIELNELIQLAIERKGFALSLQQDYKRDTAAIPLIQQYRTFDNRFDSITEQYENYALRQYDSLIWHPIFFAEEVNLDEDSLLEVILFIGSNFSTPEMVVFDKVNGSYSMIGAEHLWMHNEYPEYEVINTATEVLIKTTQFYGRGSGAWLKVNHYHKVIDSTLSLVFRAPTAANMSLGFSGMYISGNLVKDSLFNSEIHLFYSVNAQIDNRYEADSSRFDQLDILEDEVFTAGYSWDSSRDTFQTTDF
ncbi:MAG: hypothetical protein AAFP08_08175, partial [Bacteroidota bacterium]